MKTQIKLYKQLAIYYTLKIAFEFMLWIFLTLAFAIVAVEKFGVKSYSLLFTIFLVLSIASGVLCFTFSIVENMNRSRILARWVFNFCILVPYKSLDSKAFYLGAKLDKLCYAANIDEKNLSSDMTLWVSKQLIEIKQYFESQKDPILQIVTPNADSLKNKLTAFNVEQVNIMQLAITFDKKNINYYELLEILKDEEDLTFVTNDYFFKLILIEYQKENKLNNSNWTCNIKDLLQWQRETLK